MQAAAKDQSVMAISLGMVPTHAVPQFRARYFMKWMLVTATAISSALPTIAMARQTRAGIEYASKWGSLITTLRLLPRQSATGCLHEWNQ